MKVWGEPVLEIESGDIIDKSKLLVYLNYMMDQANNLAFGSHSQVAVKAYAQAHAMKMVMDAVVDDNFTFMPDDTVLN